MKASEVRELSDKERQEKIDDLQQEFFNLKFQLATGKIENPGRLRLMRRDIARIKTIQKELAAKAESGEDLAKEESKA
ncbi:LSU ribosomal protein L29p (L35e) [hydrothermal vent metagenome]|uniref:Large ribosomal subunit protein uL29 n=1 Tax=hydrothermal vent metagenome TaxID=652676 RepID=A0A3B1DKV2_9ZZZZ